MKLKIREKELNIKFGYKPTLKERLISRIMRAGITEGKGEIENTEKIEDLLLFLPEILLVGLQVYHKDEYGYNYDTKEGKEEQLEKAFDLIDEYASSEGADLMKLFNDLQEEMKNDSFLASLFQKEEQAEKVEETVQPKLEAVQSEN